MIIGKDWIWLHFPKNGGSSAQALLKKNFQNDPEVTFDEINPEKIIWHENIPKRMNRDPSADLSGKRVVCIFRRLPDWILSRVHFEASRPPHHTATREMIEAGQFFNNNGSKGLADRVFVTFNTPPVDVWVRLENMHQGFEEFFSRRLDPLEKKRNENRNGYIREIDFWFTKEQLENLYHANPLWAEAEKKVYGSLYV